MRVVRVVRVVRDTRFVPQRTTGVKSSSSALRNEWKRSPSIVFFEFFFEPQRMPAARVLALHGYLQTGSVLSSRIGHLRKSNPFKRAGCQFFFLGVCRDDVLCHSTPTRTLTLTHALFALFALFARCAVSRCAGR